MKPKIIGGYTVLLSSGCKISIGSIRKDGQHYCGATYIDRLFVLTAANCIDKMLEISLSRPFDTFSVSLGGIFRQTHESFDVKNVNTHKDYIFTNFAESGRFSLYDIGIILVSR